MHRSETSHPGLKSAIASWTQEAAGPLTAQDCRTEISFAGSSMPTFQMSDRRSWLRQQRPFAVSLNVSSMLWKPILRIGGLNSASGEQASATVDARSHRPCRADCLDGRARNAGVGLPIAATNPDAADTLALDDHRETAL